MAQKPRKCGHCGKVKGPDGSTHLSQKGLHIACARIRMAEAADELAGRHGSGYEEWRRRTLAGMTRLDAR